MSSESVTKNTASQRSQGWWKTIMQTRRCSSEAQKLFSPSSFSLGFSLQHLTQLGSSSFKATDCNRKSVVIGSSGMLGEVTEVAALQIILQDFPGPWNQAAEAWLTEGKHIVLQRMARSLRFFYLWWRLGSRGIIGRQLCQRVDKGYLSKRSFCSEIKLSVDCLLWKQIESSIASSTREANFVD